MNKTIPAQELKDGSLCQIMSENRRGCYALKSYNGDRLTIISGPTKGDFWLPGGFYTVMVRPLDGRKEIRIRL